VWGSNGKFSPNVALETALADGFANMAFTNAITNDGLGDWYGTSLASLNAGSSINRFGRGINDNIADSDYESTIFSPLATPTGTGGGVKVDFDT
jgi:hypothetical protein